MVLEELLFTLLSEAITFVEHVNLVFESAAMLGSGGDLAEVLATFITPQAGRISG